MTEINEEFERALSLAKRASFETIVEALLHIFDGARPIHVARRYNIPYSSLIMFRSGKYRPTARALAVELYNEHRREQLALLKPSWLTRTP